MQFNFVLVQIKGEENFLANALSRDHAFKSDKTHVGTVVLSDRFFESSLGCGPMEQREIDHNYPGKGYVRVGVNLFSSDNNYD